MFKEELALVPHHPGCYLMKNSDGNVIYVGKSKNLKNRLSSYFRSSHTGKTAMLVRDIAKFEYILTSSNLEALLLEINLIKKYNPKYNILLRDDKSYPYIELTNESVPRLVVVRNANVKKNRSHKLFGPYPNVTAARETVDILNRIYPLRKCKTYPKKECLYYHIGECLGYCTHNIDKEVINNMRNEIISFLNGNHEIVTAKIKKSMDNYADKLMFEKAIEYKNMLDYINITLEKQKVELDDNIDRGFGLFTLDNGMKVAFMHGHEDAKCKTLQNVVGATREWVDIVCCGHYHNASEHTFQDMKLYVNGSLCGTGPYALKNRLFAKPNQKLLLVDNNIIDININI